MRDRANKWLFHAEGEKPSEDAERDEYSPRTANNIL